jgi:hypothetical protein
VRERSTAQLEVPVGDAGDLLEHREQQVIVAVSGQSALADALCTGQGCIQEALDGAKHRFPDAALAGGRPHLDPQIRCVWHTAMP